MKSRINKMVLVWIIAGLAMILTTRAADAQGLDRRMEFSIASSTQVYFQDDDESFLMNLPVRLGVFVTPNLLVEAENIFTLVSEEFGYIVSLNLSYNFTSGKKVMPFFLLGAGRANGIPVGNTAYEDCCQRKFRVLNMGTGLKFLVSQRAALRIEYRLQNFSPESQGDYQGGTNGLSTTVHSLFTGVSLFF
jgi:hypothetical protein